MLLSGGQAGDNPYLLPVLDAIAIRGPAGGRPRKRPDLLLADTKEFESSLTLIL